MKKAIIFSQIFLTLILCGCTQSDEIGNNDIIVSFFADFNENTLFEVSAEIPNLQKKGESWIETAYGSSIKNAYSNLMNKLKNPPYSGHSKILILGDGLCTNGLFETVQYFSDINVISPNINLVFTEDSLSDFEPLSVYNMTKENSFPTTPLYTLFLPKNETAVIPVISSKDKSPQKIGGVITKNLNFKYYISEEEYNIYSLLTNKPTDSFYKNHELLKSKSKISTKDGILSVELIIILKNADKDEQKELKSTVFSEILSFTEMLKKENLTTLLEKDGFDTAEIKIEVKASDTGKIKDERQKRS